MLILSVVALVIITVCGALLLHITSGSNVIDSVYWAVVTLTTVGFGDLVPQEEPVLFGMYEPLPTALAFKLVILYQTL